ncbi:MAG TPA: EAL domain-containing protein [Solirubrobacteraceae bacterium]|nr:EAL domain-containing protein [Solirubrobacteraceae bacterium]
MAASSTARSADRVSLLAGGRRVRRILFPRAAEAAPQSRAGIDPAPWLARLRRALQRGAFVLHFQPIVSLADGRVSHHEALLRLADEPDGRLVAPAAFLGAAERNGLIGEIDRMVIEQVAALLSRRARLGRGPLGHAPGTPIAVNVSALSVTDRAMLEFLARTLRRHVVAAEELIVEVTETAAISDMQAARTFCAGVESLGCAIALDDFGAGFGSFQYLKHLPFTYLKIDGEFIRALPRSRTDQLVVKALVGIVGGLGRRTVAEYVGDAATLEMVRAFGVDYAQGFQVGRPRAEPALALPSEGRRGARSPAAASAVRRAAPASDRDR